MGTSTRKLEVYCSPEERSSVEEWLGEEGLYWYAEEIRLRNEGELCRITVYAPLYALPRIYAGVSKRIDLRRRENSIIVLDVEAAVGAPHRVTGRRYRILAQRPRLKPLFMLRQEAEELSMLTLSGLILAVVAGLVALAGLVLDNPYIILGAMLLSPVLGPVYAFSASTVTGDRRSMMRSIVTLSVLLLSAMLASLACTGLYVLAGHGMEATREIVARAEITPLTALIPFLLGGVAMIGPSTGAEDALVGVAIAAAIIPPAAALGWSLVSLPGLALRIGLNLLFNIAGLLVGGSIVARLLGPEA